MSKKKQNLEFNRLTAVSPLAQFTIRMILGLFALICCLPFLFVVVISFTDNKAILTEGYKFIPSVWSVGAYKAVFEYGDQLMRSLFNSVFITIIGTILSVIICVLYSYAIFRRDYKYRKFFTFFSFFTMLFGGGLAPTVIVTRTLFGNDNLVVLIVPLLVNVFNFIVMRTFFQASVPYDMIEAASVDGCGEWRTLLQIVLPVSKPGIATIALLNMLAYWNEWFIPQLYVGQEPKMWPLQYFLVKLQQTADAMYAHAGRPGAQRSDLPTQNLIMAICVIIVIPIAFAYPFFQRYIVKGLAVGSVKG